MDYQTFLNNELARSVDGGSSGDLQLFILHYHQAMLAAVEHLQACPQCAIDLRCMNRLKVNARDLQHSEFANIQALMQVIKTRLSDTALLCSSCQTAFQHDILRRFYIIHTGQGNKKIEGEE